MKYRYDPSGRSFTQPGQGPFPGISDPFFGGGMSNTTLGNNPFPYDPSKFAPGVPNITIQPSPVSESSLITLPGQAAADAATSGKTGGFNLGNSINDIKGIVDRMGGIDGIVATMTKVQKVVGSFSQMAPLLKVIAGSFGKKKKGSADDDDDDIEYKPRRKKPRRRSGARKGTGTGTSGQRRRPRKR